MDNKVRKQNENVKVLTENPQPLKISRAYFDEKTGALTLKIASEEEIAEAERLTKKS